MDICKETIVRMLVWNCLETLALEFLFPYGFVYCNGPTNVRKAGEGVPVSCHAPYLRPGGGKGVTVLVVSEPRFRHLWKTY